MYTIKLSKYNILPLFLGDDMQKKYPSILLNSIIFLFIVICIIIFPEYAYKSSLDGLNLWFNVVCPALLPFFICVEILIGLGVVNFIGAVFKPIMSFLFNIPGEGAFAFVMSIASGYPVGAKIVASLRSENICNKAEAQRMISLCSTSGPLFVIGAVSVGILNNPKIASVLLLSHYLSALSCGVIMRFYKINEKSISNTTFTNPFTELVKYRNKDKRSLGQIIADSVKNSINLILIVGGYIVFFSVTSKMLQITGIFSIIPKYSRGLISLINIAPDTWSVFFIGLLEVTNGVKECAKVSIPYMTKISLISFFIGFGGISVNAQVSGIIQDTDINFPLYLVIKVFQGIAAASYSTILLKFYQHIPAFNNYLFHPEYLDTTWRNYINLSFGNLINMLIFLILLSSLIRFFNFLQKKTMLH